MHNYTATEGNVYDAFTNSEVDYVITVINAFILSDGSTDKQNKFDIAEPSPNLLTC